MQQFQKIRASLEITEMTIWKQKKQFQKKNSQLDGFNNDNNHNEGVMVKYKKLIFLKLKMAKYLLFSSILT